MFQWNTRIATVLIVSAAMATTAAAQPQHKQGGGAPAARPAPAAPAPHAAVCPSVRPPTRIGDGAARADAAVNGFATTSLPSATLSGSL